MKNILSIDLEDWHQLIARRVTGQLLPAADTSRQLDCLLRLLNDQNAKATFFVLGMVAERYPELVKRVAAEGHEIACHGYAHLIVKRLTPAQFAEDTRRAKQVIEDLAGEPVLGYRAAEFSIDAGSLWALQVLAELGFQYDSSIVPIRHRRYGIPGFSRRPMRYEVGAGISLIEVPLATVEIGGVTLPAAGGGYFRLAPFSWIRRALARMNAEGVPMATYFHPYEFDPQRLDVFEYLTPTRWKQRMRGRQLNFHQNLRRTTMPAKLAALLRAAQFTTFQDFLHDAELEESRELLPTAG